jgi:translation initiation factor 2A
MEFSPDGAMYAVVDATGVALHDTTSHAVLRRIEAPQVLAVAFSPRSTFVITFQRPANKGPDGAAPPPNLRVWAAARGAPALGLHQKSLNRDHWPSVQFTADESAALHMVTNTLHAYSPADFGAGPQYKLPVKGVAAFAVSPAAPAGGPSLVVVYVPEAKGSPGHIALYPCTPVAGGALPTPLSRRSFFRANDARFYWNAPGTAVLALTSADVDATNQSYYGEQKLYFLPAAGGQDCAVPLPKEGPVHDVQWSPRGDCFVTVAGFMPAKSTVFTDTCVPKYDLGSGPYSLARWSPHGRFLVLAGFGNLPGDLAFFDRKADGKFKPMGSSRAENGVTLQWSPCGRHVLAATVAPRLRVDNGIQVFKYDGTLVARAKREVLLGAAWLPAARGVTYEDRPQSPRAAGGAGGAAAPAAAALPAQPMRAAGYVPPHLRGNPAAAAAAKDSFSLARDANDKGGRIPVGATAARAPAAGARLPPGAAPPPTKAASKNAKRRAKKGGEGGGAEGAADGVAGLTL